MHSHVTAMLDRAAAPPPSVSFEGPAAWWASHQSRTVAFEAPIDRAIVGALAVDRVAWAFAGGYVSALQQMIPALGRADFASLAATEEGGAHPRAIQTTLGGGRLRGGKRWVTLPGHEGAPSTFFVVARRPEADAAGRPQLALVRVRSDAPGVLVTRSSAPFVPELSHGELALDVAVEESDVLPGDGYADYLKPFRTVEDLHVHGALVGLMLGYAQRVDGPKPPRERLLAALVGIRSLALADPKSPAVHLALAGVISSVESARRELEPCFLGLDDATRAAWTRDAVLFSVANKARAARLEAAWAPGGA